MRPSTIRFLILTICATAVVPVVAATDADASSRHPQKHHARTYHGLKSAWASEVQPVASSRNWGGDACQGGARSFDCKKWPPPIDDDPDRRATDGGP